MHSFRNFLSRLSRSSLDTRFWLTSMLCTLRFGYARNPSHSINLEDDAMGSLPFRSKIISARWKTFQLLIEEKRSSSTAMHIAYYCWLITTPLPNDRVPNTCTMRDGGRGCSAWTTITYLGSPHNVMETSDQNAS